MPACRQPPSSTAPSPRRTCSSSMRRRSSSSRRRSPEWPRPRSPRWRSRFSAPASSRPPRRWRAPRPGCSHGSLPSASWLAAHRVGLQEGLVLGAAAAGTYAVAILLTAHSFRPGHLAATIVAATVGALAVAISARRGSVELVAASLAWVGGVFAIATGFDVPEFAVEAVHRSYGGWALIAASAGVLAACFAFQLLFRGGVQRRRARRRRRARARRLRGRHRPHLTRRRRARVDLDRLAAARAEPRLPRPRGERVPHSASSRSRDDHVGARRSRAPRQRVARRPRRDVACRCLRGHGGRPRPALPAPAGAAALARRLDRRVRDGTRHHRRPRRRSGSSTTPSRCATRSRGSRPRPPSSSSARSPGETRRAAISSPSPGRPRSSR